MSGAITIKIQDTGNWTLAELKNKIETYVASLTKKDTKNAITPFVASLGIDSELSPNFDYKETLHSHLLEKYC